MKRVLLTQDVLVSAEQKCLHSVNTSSASHVSPPASRLGVHKNLGGNTARTADPN